MANLHSTSPSRNVLLGSQLKIEKTQDDKEEKTQDDRERIMESKEKCCSIIQVLRY